MSTFDQFLDDVSGVMGAERFRLLENMLRDIENNNDDTALELYGPLRKLLSSKRYTVQEKLAGIDVLIEPYGKAAH